MLTCLLKTVYSAWVDCTNLELWLPVSFTEDSVNDNDHDHDEDVCFLYQCKNVWRIWRNVWKQAVQLVMRSQDETGLMILPTMAPRQKEVNQICLSLPVFKAKIKDRAGGVEVLYCELFSLSFFLNLLSYSSKEWREKRTQHRCVCVCTVKVCCLALWRCLLSCLVKMISHSL